MPPPQGSLIHSLGHNTPGKADIVVQSVLLALALVAVGLRLWSRRLERASIGADGWLILVATVSSSIRFVGISLLLGSYQFTHLAQLVTMGHYVVGIIMVLLCGLGLHSLEVARKGGPDAFVSFIELTYTGDLLWTTGVALIQLSILYYYTRKFPQRTLKWLAYITIVLCSAAWIATFLATALFCLPPRRLWLADTPGHCGDRKQLYLSSAVSELLLNVMIAILPLPLLWRQKARKSTQLTGIYLFGAVIIAITGLRIKYILPPDPSDPTYGSSVGAILSSIILPLGIILACLPTMLPAMRRLIYPVTSSTRMYSHGSRSLSAEFWKRAALSSGATQLEEPQMPLVHITQPTVVKTSDSMRQGQIQVTSDWEIRSTRDSSRACRGPMNDV